MRHSILGLLGIVGLASPFLLHTTTASAQENENNLLTGRVAAPSQALELRIGTGYTQGFGRATADRTLPETAGPGIAGNAAIDYRISPHWSVGIEGQYQEFSAEQNTSARGLAGNLGATYHFAPVLRGDPWVRLGVGYRLLWEINPVGGATTAGNTDVVRHGFELGALKLGYDMRVTEDLAIAPVIGADLDLFLWQGDSGHSDSALGDASRVSMFAFGGLEGRFDIGGRRTGGYVATNKVVATAAEIPTPLPPPPVVTAMPIVVMTVPMSPSVSVSQDILNACEMKLGNSEDSPKFDFDDSKLIKSDMDVLDQVADCFTSGPLSDRTMSLVGRTDPRGADAYNLKLGMERAESVSHYLEGRGVGVSHLDVTTAGKLGATGHDEAGWALDRRVDITLQK